MSESEKDTRFESTKIGVEITRDDKAKESNPDAERKRKLIEELTDNVEQKPRELPKIKQLVAQIPESGKLGQKFIVRLGKRFDSGHSYPTPAPRSQTGGGRARGPPACQYGNKDEVSY